MQFTVPKFIERQPRIIGPLTFKQFVFVGTAGGICLFLYFIVPFYLFIISAVFLLGAALSLAFVKIGKDPLPVVIKNFFVYIFNPKVYLWKKKITPYKTPDFFKKRKKIGKEEFEEKKEESVLKISGDSQLRKLSTRIETRSK